MPLILNIDTATTYGAVGLSSGSEMLAVKESKSQKDHAAFLQPAIKEILNEAGKTLQELDAIAVTIGPGSYTGLRVSLASAKGLCYALGKPLIAINTLQVMAQAAIENYLLTNNNANKNKPPVFCPMIDARRMEVFTASYNIHGEEISPTKSLIIDENIFTLPATDQQIVFSGDGSVKISTAEHLNFSFSVVPHTVQQLAFLALKKFQLLQFADVAYCEPFYLKPFFTTAKIANEN